ncbi:MAG: FHA domain-containing protein [Fibrobacterota bacterium]
MLNILIKHRGTLIKTYRVSKDGSTVGRLPTNDIIINDRSVSRNHLKIHLPENGGIAEVSDMGSLNGTYCGDKQVDSISIESPLDLRIGDFVLSISPADQDQSPAAPARPVPEENISPEEPSSGEDEGDDDQSSLIFSSSDKGKSRQSMKLNNSKAILIEVERQIVYKINKTIMTLGNTDDDDIYVEGGMLSSGKIALLRAEESGFSIEASNKLTGKFKVNGHKVSRANLEHGDKINIGNSRFSFMIKTG